MVCNRICSWLPIATLVAGVILWPASARGQHSEPPPPAAYAIEGATLVKADGSKSDSVTIVVRRGFIEAMGSNVQVPADAEVLEGDSLVVYPGIIDAQGEPSYVFPEPETPRSEIASWAPPRDVQGFMPHRRVADYLTATGEKLKSQRMQGIVAAGIHPEGPVMPGRGTVLLFRKGAGTPEQLVVRPALGPVMSFRGASDVYPGTRFGVAAFLRQSFEDARHHGLRLAAHADDPRGLRVPKWDRDYAILRDAMTGQVRVFFVADRAEDIRQVLSLATEYGFQPVIVGGDEAWKVADQLREAQVPVLVSLDFPKPERWEPTKQEQLDPAEELEKRRIEAIYANAGRLAAAGVTFALTSGGGRMDIREGARKAIEYGLSERQALAAVSRTPAALLGTPYLSRIEVGMPATFVATDGPLFIEDTEIRYTFVDGELEKAKPKTAGSGEAPTVDVSGVWEVHSSFEGQDYRSRLTLTQEGGELTGTQDSNVGRAALQDGSVSGNGIFWIIEVDYGQGPFEIRYSGTVERGEMSGTGTMPFGTLTWTAKRVGGPGEGE